MNQPNFPDLSIRHCYVILETQYDPGHGYVPSIIFEDHPGHYPMRGHDEFSAPWYWGKTFSEAQATCESVNADNGITPAIADTILCSSMFAKKRATA